MTTEYKNDVAEAFYNFKEQGLIPKYTEQASLKAFLGENLKNITILDIGCGFGYHSRWLADEGALVTGVDISEDLIKLALKIESENPKDIEYHVDSAANLHKLKSYRMFDMCIMMYVLQTAQNFDELLAYFQKANDHLKIGGKLIGVFDTCYDQNIVGKFGYNYDSSVASVEPGQLYTGNAAVGDGQKNFVCQQLKVDKQMMEKICKLSGFQEIKWHNPVVSSDGIALKGEEFWHDFVNIPVDQYFVMTK